MWTEIISVYNDIGMQRKYTIDEIKEAFYGIFSPMSYDINLSTEDTWEEFLDKLKKGDKRDTK